MKLELRGFALFGLLASVTIPASAVMVIDDFTQGATNLTVEDPIGSAESQQGSINVLGSQRDVLLQVTNNPLASSANFRTVPGSGMCQYQSGPGVWGRVTLDYDGEDSEGSDGVLTAGPGMNLDLTGEVGFRLDFAFCDLGTSGRIDAYTYEGAKWSYGVFSLVNTTPASVYVDLNEFSPVSGGGVDFAHLDRLVIRFDQWTASTDFAITGIATRSPVPEPASLSALALGAFGLVARRRSRKLH
jgi:hypothetical protein